MVSMLCEWHGGKDSVTVVDSQCKEFGCNIITLCNPRPLLMHLLTIFFSLITFQLVITGALVRAIWQL